MKRILFNEWQLYNLSISPVKGFRGDKLARLVELWGFLSIKKSYLINTGTLVAWWTKSSISDTHHTMTVPTH